MRTCLPEEYSALARFLDVSADPTIAVDSEGKILFLNDLATSLFQYPEEELLGQHINMLVPEDRRNHHVKLVADFSATRAARSMDAGMELAALRKDGIEIPVEIGLSPVRINDVTITLCAVRDITERKKVEEQLYQSIERYALAVRGTQDGIWDWNIVTGEVYYSPRWKELLGYQDEENEPHVDFFTALLHPEDRERTWQAAKAHLESRVPYDTEHRLRHKNGHFIWVRDKGQAVWNDAGEPVRMVGSISDITERMAVDERLRESTERYELAVQGTQDGIWDWNIQTGVAYQSLRSMEILGYQDGELEPHIDAFTALLHPEDRERTWQAIEAHLEHRAPYDIEYRLRHKNGKLIWLHAKGQASWNDAGEPVRMVGSVSDITKRKEAEKNLQQSEDRLKEAQRIAKIGNWERNFATDEGWWSDATYRIFGVDPQELTIPYETYLERVHPNDRQRVTKIVRRAAQEGEPFDMEYRIVLPDGEVKVIHSRAEVAYDEEGRSTRLIGTAQDITDQIQLEREVISISERERNRIGRDLHDGLGQILVGASWSLQNLMKIVVAEGSPHEEPLKKLQATLDSSIEETKRMAQLLSPGFSGGLGLSAALQELVSQLDGVSSIDCHSKCSFTGEISSAEVAAHLYRIAQEGMTNALKHSQAENVYLTFEKIEDLLYLEVLDDGVGIDAERRELSTGLGLRSMNYRARMINGGLEVTQRQSGGTRVLCTCPL